MKKFPKFPPVPINDSRLFTMEVSSSGCEIYLPIADGDDLFKRKQELREYLDSQIPYEPPLLTI